MNSAVIGHRNKKQKYMKTRLCFGMKPLANSDLVINIGCKTALLVYLCSVMSPYCHCCFHTSYKYKLSNLCSLTTRAHVSSIIFNTALLIPE